MNNLLDILNAQISPDLIQGARRILNESDEKIEKGFSASFAGLLQAIPEMHQEKIQSLEGWLNKAAKYELNTAEIISHLNLLPSESPRTPSDHFLQEVLGDRLAGFNNLISNYSGLSISSAASIVNASATFLSHALGSQMLSNGLSAGSIQQKLVAILPGIQKYLPEGMSGFLSSSATEFQGTSPIVSRKSESKKWILPLILLGLLGIGIWWWMNGEDDTEEIQQDTAVIDSAGASIHAAFDSAASVAGQVANDLGGQVDSNGNWIASKGEKLEIKLPDGTLIHTYSGNLEDQLYKFINDPGAVAGKDIWFNFEDVLFESGKSVLKPGYESQLQNTVAILKAHPNVVIKLGGYTDNSGDSVKNMKLSEQRAKTVYNKLIALGAEQTSFDAKPYEGYGPQHPIEDNSSESGRAQNRRIAISVRQK